MFPIKSFIIPAFYFCPILVVRLRFPGQHLFTKVRKAAATSAGSGFVPISQMPPDVRSPSIGTGIIQKIICPTFAGLSGNRTTNRTNNPGIHATFQESRTAATAPQHRPQ